MMYYRVAFCVEQASGDTQTLIWKWRSTVLTSTQALFTLLKVYSNVPQEQIRIFFASSEHEMDAMLTRQNQGLVSSSMTADQFLTDKSINALDVKRLELELSIAKDHNTPYVFTLPSALSELLAWTRLLARVQNGELES